MKGRHSGGSSRDHGPCLVGTPALRPNMAVVMSFALAMLLCCVGPVLGKEVKGLSFYPPFQSFNARGMRCREGPACFLCVSVVCTASCFGGREGVSEGVPVVPKCSGPNHKPFFSAHRGLRVVITSGFALPSLGHGSTFRCATVSPSAWADTFAGAGETGDNLRHRDFEISPHIPHKQLGIFAPLCSGGVASRAALSTTLVVTEGISPKGR